MTDRRAAGWLAAAVAAAYATSFTGGFQLDDWAVVVGDPRVQDLGAWWRSMPGIRPLLKLTWALGHVSGLGLVGFHAVNVAIHAASALLGFALLRRLGERAGGDPDRARWAARVGALLFALHPAQTEAVTYVSGRSASLSGMLVLASTLLWLRAQEHGARRADVAGACLLFAAAVAVKETAIVLPLGLAVIAVTDPRPGHGWRGFVRAAAPLLATAFAAAIVLLASSTYRAMLAESRSLRDPLANVATHLHAIAWLVGQVLRPGSLDADPDLRPVLHLDPGALAVGALWTALVVLAIRLRRVWPVFAFATLWFLLWLAPTGWVVPRAEPASDRQLYLALLGPAWLVAWAITNAFPALRPGVGWGRVAVGALVIAFGLATSLRSLVYRDEVRFWSDVVEKSPGNARAHNNLGLALAVACRNAEAEAALLRALERDPAYVRAAVNLRLLRDGARLDPRARPCGGARTGTDPAGPLPR